MRIISKYKDYYDSVQGLSFDKELIYVREISRIKVGDYKDPSQNRDRESLKSLNQNFAGGFPKFYGSVLDKTPLRHHSDPFPVIDIHFCGKSYRFFSFYEGVTKGFVLLKTPDDVIQYIRESIEGGEKSVESYLKAMSGRKNTPYNWLYGDKEDRKASFSGDFTMKAWEAWNDATEKIKPSVQAYREWNTPVVVCGFNFERFGYLRDDNGHNLFVNPPLKDIGFHRIVDAFTAYQEIDMFLGNELAGQNDPLMPVGGDLIVRDSKGFDEWSFKTPPGTKMRNGRT